MESVLRRGNGGDPRTLDPSLADDDHAFRVLTDLYEGLVVADSTGVIVPGVASDWSISDDGLTYTFRLRSDAAWSDGNPVMAQHFVDAFQRSLSPDSASVYNFLLQPVRNSSRVREGDAPPAELGISAADPTTLIIELESPAPHFLAVLTMPIAFPLPPEASNPHYRFGDPGSFVGNGPYVLQQWQPGHRIRLEKNRRFRDAESVSIDAVEYYAIEELQTEFNMYRAGEIDITASVPGTHVRQLADDDSSELRIAPKLGLYYLAFDLSEPPFDNADLRKALSLAIDRRKLAEIIGRGEVAAFGLVPDGIPGYEPARYAWQQASDAERIAEARRALASSGFPSGSSAELRLTYDVGDIHEKVALAVSGMWRDVLGVETELDKREWRYFLETRDQRDQWQIMRFAWIGDFNHPSTFTDLFTSNNPQNLPGYASDSYDGLVSAAAGLQDPGKQSEKLATAESILLADHAIAPLYFYVSKHMVRPGVNGFDNNVLDRHPSRYLSLEPYSDVN